MAGSSPRLFFSGYTLLGLIALWLLNDSDAGDMPGSMMLVLKALVMEANLFLALLIRCRRCQRFWRAIELLMPLALALQWIFFLPSLIQERENPSTIIATLMLAFAIALRATACLFLGRPIVRCAPCVLGIATPVFSEGFVAAYNLWFARQTLSAGDADLFFIATSLFYLYPTLERLFYVPGRLQESKPSPAAYWGVHRTVSLGTPMIGSVFARRLLGEAYHKPPLLSCLVGADEHVNDLLIALALASTTVSACDAAQSLADIGTRWRTGDWEPRHDSSMDWSRRPVLHAHTADPPAETTTTTDRT